MRTLAFAAVLCALAPSAAAQCSPAWQPGYFTNGLSGYGRALAAFDDGGGPRLFVGGHIRAAGAAVARDVAAFANGGWDALGDGLGPMDMDDEVRALLVHDDGSGPKLYAGGNFTHSGAASALHIARWDGAQWTQVGAGLAMNVHALASFDDGSGPKLYAGGNVSPTIGGTYLARWDGSNWTILAQDLQLSVRALEVYDDGSGPALYAAGYLDPVAGTQNGIARWNGAGWSNVGGGISGYGYALHVFDDGTGSALYVAGDFNQAGGVQANHVARWDGTSWSALGSGLGSSYPYTLADFDDGSGPKLYVAGDLSVPGGTTFASIFCWDGSSWTIPGGGTGYTINALELYDDGSGVALYATGGFQFAGGVPARGIAKWNGSVWSNPDSTQDAGAVQSVRALVAHDDGTGEALYATGTVHGAPARFDGTSWTSLGGGIAGGQAYALASHDDGGGRALFAAGLFDHAGGVPVANIARWNGSGWSALGSGINNTVVCLLSYDDGSGTQLYASGAFSQAGGVAAAHVARWNGTTWSSVGAGLPNSSFVDSLVAFDDGTGMKLWAQGSSNSRTYRWNGTSWTQMSTLALNALCVFDDGHGPRLYGGGAAAGTVYRWSSIPGWQSVGSGFPGAINALAVFDDGTGPALYAGGDTNTANYSTANLVRWDGQNWSAVGQGIWGDNPRLLSLAVAKLPTSSSPGLFIGGSFFGAGDFASSSIAEWRGCAAIGTPFCLGDLPTSGCPCANVGSWRHGCENSAATGGAVLHARGTTQPDTLQLESTGELASAPSVVLQGTSLIAPIPFGDGTRCVGGVLKRLYVQTAVGGTLLVPAPGDPSISARSAALGNPIAPGSMRAYQVYYRDPSTSYCPAPTGNSWNASSGIKIVW